MAIPLVPWAYAALLIAGLLVVCVAVIVAMRDQESHSPPRLPRFP
jgi:hypothetical protein